MNCNSTLAILLTTLLLVGCGKNTGTDLLILHDVTDKQRIGPWELTGGVLEASFDLDISPFSYSHLALGRFSDARYDAWRELQLEAGGIRLFEDLLARQADVRSYLHACDSLIYTTHDDNTRSRSVVFRVLVDGLTKLARSPASVKRCLAYTDCCENSSALSIYNHDARWISASADHIQQLLLEGVTVPDLTGVEVWLIHQAADPLDGERFERMAGIFARILREHGAVVRIAGNYTSSSS